MPHDTTTREVVELTRQRLGAMDLDGVADLFAEDADFDYPFGYAGSASEIHGREALRAHLHETRDGIGERMRIAEFNAVVHDTTDPAVAVVEWEVVGTTVATGESFRFPSGVSVITVHDGEITRFRDYTNPVGAAVATGRSAELGGHLAVTA